jgi:hypothetical protein
VEALLDRLSSIDPQLRTIVEMRVFAGFSIPDIAARLNCGERTVDRRWAFASKWLEHQLAPPGRNPFGGFPARNNLPDSGVNCPPALPFFFEGTQPKQW